MTFILITLILATFSLFLIPTVQIWSIVECARWKESEGNKVVWIIALVLLSPISGICFGLACAKSLWLRIFSIALSAGFVLVIFGGFYLLKSAKSEAVTGLKEEILHLQDISVKELSNEEWSEYVDDLDRLKADIGATPLSKYEDLLYLESLVELSQLQMANKELTKEEYSSWLSFFKSRKNHTPEDDKALKAKIAAPQTGHPSQSPDQKSAPEK